MTKQENKNSAKKKLIPAVAMLTTSAVMLSTSTYAWFTMSREVEVQNIQMVATVPENIQISLGEIDNHSEALSLSKNGGYLKGKTAAAPTSDYDWSNIADVSHYYKFGKLIPASSTNGENIYFTPDAAGVGRTLTATAKFYQAAEKIAVYKYETDSYTKNGTGDVAAATSHIVTESDTFGVESNNTYTKATNWNKTFDDGYYIDIPVWLRTSATNEQEVYVCGYVTSQNKTDADNDTDDLYKAVRVAILTDDGSANGGCLTLADGLDKYIDPVTSQTSHAGKFPSSQAYANILDSDNYNGTTLGRITNDNKIYAVSSTTTNVVDSTHVVEVEHKEITQNKGGTKIATLPVGSGSAYGDAQKVIIRVWLEGEDGNCWNENAGQNWNIALKFMTSSLPES